MGSVSLICLWFAPQSARDLGKRWKLLSLREVSWQMHLWYSEYSYDSYGHGPWRTIQFAQGSLPSTMSWCFVAWSMCAPFDSFTGESWEDLGSYWKDENGLNRCVHYVYMIYISYVYTPSKSISRFPEVYWIVSRNCFQYLGLSLSIWCNPN